MGLGDGVGTGVGEGVGNGAVTIIKFVMDRVILPALLVMVRVTV